MRRHRRIKRMLAGLLIVWPGIVPATAAFAIPGPKNVSLNFVSTDIPVVLTALAGQVGFDLVVAPQTEGQINVNLSDVDWRTALDAIAMANGLSYRWRDDVLVVTPADAAGGGDMEHRVVNLRWADPTAVKAVLTNVLSTNGKVDVLTAQSSTPAPPGAERTSVPAPLLVISETPQAMPAVLALIDSLDVPRPQFEIEAKFVETNIDDQQSIGLNWPTQITATIADRSATQTTEGEATTTVPPAAQYQIPDGKIWRFGTLNVDQLTGVLEMLSRKGQARLLSDPRVTVLENERAVMRVTTRIPVQTLSRFTEGTVIQDIVEFQDLDVGISLSVIPRLNDTGTVTLDVEPVVEEITGYTGPVNNQRPITAKRTVRTAVRVRNNETIVIGGLVRETEYTTKSGIFLLSDIPFLGALFSHRKVEKKKTDLLIFITPRILEPVAIH
ncbi:MAG: hypothetical protein AB1792_10250 [Candidatus Zixiibacteriota bacterium]